MMDPVQDDTQNEEKAQRRYIIMNLVRFAAIGAVMAGFAITYDAIEAPKSVGIVAALGGVAVFFYGPKMLARQWKKNQG